MSSENEPVLRYAQLLLTAHHNCCMSCCAPGPDRSVLQSVSSEAACLTGPNAEAVMDNIQEAGNPQCSRIRCPVSMVKSSCYMGMTLLQAELRIRVQGMQPVAKLCGHYHGGHSKSRKNKFLSVADHTSGIMTPGHHLRVNTTTRMSYIHAALWGRPEAFQSTS